MRGFRRLMLASAVAASVSMPAHAFDMNSMADKANDSMDKASESADKTLDNSSQAASDTMNQANARTDAAMGEALGQLEPAGEAKGLVDNLSSQLGVSGEQAAGGAGAMLALAKNQLAGDQFSAITGQVPGLQSLLGGGEQGGGMAQSMLSKVTDMGAVKNAFNAVGLSPDMVSQFSGPMLSFLGNKGIGSTVLDSLKGVWGMGG